MHLHSFENLIATVVQKNRRSGTSRCRDAVNPSFLGIGMRHIRRQKILVLNKGRDVLEILALREVQQWFQENAGRLLDRWKETMHLIRRDKQDHLYTAYYLFHPKNTDAPENVPVCAAP